MGELVDTLKELDTKKMKIYTKKHDKITKSIIVPHSYVMTEPIQSTHFYRCQPSKYVVDKMERLSIRYYYINNVTNCLKGTFHDWKAIDKKLICSICDKHITEIKEDNSDSSKIKDIVRYDIIRKMAE